MTRITRVLAVPAVGAGYYEDLAALQADHVSLPQRFSAPPQTPGFRAIREVAEAVSVGLVLDTPSAGSGCSGQVAWGDCVAVSYSGRAGRDPVFRAQEGLATIQHTVAPVLEGRSLTSFRQLSAEVDALTHLVEVEGPTPSPQPARSGVSRRALLTAPARLLQAAQEEDALARRVTVERPLHTAVRYGVSQALLQAVALARGVTMAEVIASEWDLALAAAPVPIHAQSGDERYDNADKMIVRRIAALPHAQVDDIPGQVGEDGGEMTRYIRWLSHRIGELGGKDYHPTIHLDLHGALGQIYGDQTGRMLGQVYAWALAAEPYSLRLESPMILESRKAQIEAMATLREYIRLRKVNVQLVADEWANTLEDIRAFVEAGAADMIQIKLPDLGGLHNAIEAVLACRAAGVGAFVGGSYTETDLAARASVHVALATQADLLMAKPGLGVDESISLVQNEMARTLAQIEGGSPSVVGSHRQRSGGLGAVEPTPDLPSWKGEQPH
jgi:methylaspartate ammonia-lyase